MSVCHSLKPSSSYLALTEIEMIMNIYCSPERLLWKDVLTDGFHNHHSLLLTSLSSCLSVPVLVKLSAY